MHGLVFPLITTAAGAKFGKSEGGNVWLDPERTSPYHFYQFWLNTDDRDVERYLKLFTFLRLDRIAATMAEHAAEPGRREAQRVAGARGDRHGPRRRRGGGGDPDQRSPCSAARTDGRRSRPRRSPTCPSAGCRAPSCRTGCRSSRCWWRAGSRAPRPTRGAGIQGKGFYLNGRPIDDVELTVGEDALQGPPEERFVILRKGKKNYVRLVLEP